MIYVITVYASASFVLIELVNNVLEPLNLPANLSTIVIIALAIAFPIVIALSWIFDMTPKGIEKTKASDELKEGEVATTSNAWRFATYASIVIIIGLISLNIVNNNKISQYLKLYGKSIAVLPFINDSPDKENEYFVNGTVDAIRNNLALLKDLKVTSRLSVEHYKAALIPIPEIAAEQEVAYILTGSVQKYGNQIRLSVNLYDANDNLIWSKPYDREIREAKDQFSIQSEIANLVAGEIKVVVTPEEIQRIEKVPTTSIQANDFVLQAAEDLLIYARAWEKVDFLENAENLFHKALSYDSTYAEAYAGLGHVFFFKYNWGGDQADVYMDSLMMMANMAHSFDNQLPDAYLLRGMYYHYFKVNYQTALENYNKAIEFNPNYPVTYEFKGYILGRQTNDYIGAIECWEEVMKRERGPQNLPNYLIRLGTVYYDAGFPELAGQKYEDYLNYTGDSAFYYRVSASVELSRGNFEKMIELGQKAHDINPDRNISILNYILAGMHQEAYQTAERNVADAKKSGYVNTGPTHAAYLIWNAGRFQEAEILFNRHIESREEQIRQKTHTAVAGYSPYYLAAIYAFTDNREKAYESLNLLADKRSIPLFFVTLLKNDPMFDSIRHEERFQKIMEIIEGKYQAEHERVRKWLEKTGRM